MLNNNGLVRGFFDSLKTDDIVTQQKTPSFMPVAYKDTGNQQSPVAFEVFEEFFSTNKDIDLVVDLGTGRGGFSLFLQEQAKAINSQFVTYDTNTNSINNIKSKSPDIDARVGDVFDVYVQGNIEKMIDMSKKTAVFCDVGNVSKCFNTYSDVIKQNDIILVHDYAPNKQVFESEYRGKIWNWLEVSDKDIQDSMTRNKLVKIFEQANKAAWLCVKKTAEKVVKKEKNPNDIVTNLYMLTFNFPEQLEHTYNSMKKTPEMLERPNLILLDNSTDPAAKIANEQFAKEKGFVEYIDLGGNTGICGGRQAAAEHFDKSDADFMMFFEDDMTVNPPEKANETCRNGFRKYVPDLYNKVHKIMIKEGFDFLKFSFTEVYFDNDKQCSWYNVPQETRTEVWPHYDKLPTTGLDPNVPLTTFSNIGNMDGLTYINGEVYYANWPMIVSKEGNKKMFIETTWKRPYEQTWMSHMFKKTRAGKLKPALLLASPIWHDRIKHYKPEDRRES